MNERLISFKDDMATLFKSLIYDKFDSEHLTQDVIDKLKAEVSDYLSENHPELVVESIEEKLIQDPFNVVLHVVILNAFVSDKPFRVEFPLLYWYVSEEDDND